MGARAAWNVASAQHDGFGPGFAVLFFGPVLFSFYDFDPLIAMGADSGAK
jgi:hypothetical protein